MKTESLLMTLLAVSVSSVEKDLKITLEIDNLLIKELIEQGLVSTGEHGMLLTKDGKYLISLLTGAYDFFETQKDIRSEASDIFKAFKKKYNSFLESIKMD